MLEGYRNDGRQTISDTQIVDGVVHRESDRQNQATRSAQEAEIGNIVSCQQKPSA